jgi:hypothetical protein
MMLKEVFYCLLILLLQASCVSLRKPVQNPLVTSNEWIELFLKDASRKEMNLKGPVQQMSWTEYSYLEYDSTGTLQTDTLGGADYTSLFSFDRKGRLLAHTRKTESFDGLSKAVHYEYNEKGQLVKASIKTKNLSAEADVQYKDDRINTLQYVTLFKEDTIWHKGQLSASYQYQESRDTLELTELGTISVATNTLDILNLQSSGLHFNPQTKKWTFPFQRSFAYDAYGRLIIKKENILFTRSFFSPLLSPQTTFYTYNGQRLQSKTVYSEAPSAKRLLYRAEYDADGEVTRSEDYREDDLVSKSYLEQAANKEAVTNLFKTWQKDSLINSTQEQQLFNEKGQLIQAFSLTNDVEDKTLFTIAYTPQAMRYQQMNYNGKGQLEEARSFDDSGYVNNAVRYAYNQQGYLTTQTEECYTSGRLSEVITDVFYYDKGGNWVRHLEFHNGILYHLRKRSFLYYR